MLYRLTSSDQVRHANPHGTDIFSGGQPLPFSRRRGPSTPNIYCIPYLRPHRLTYSDQIRHASPLGEGHFLRLNFSRDPLFTRRPHRLTYSDQIRHNNTSREKVCNGRTCARPRLKGRAIAPKFLGSIGLIYANMV